ncbi:MAG: LIC_13387 family protein [Acidimicrobiales bacterium]
MLKTIRTARVCYLIGSIGFIFIGLLHTVTHWLELAGPALRQRFDEMGLIEVSGQEVTSWDLFQGTSLLMGFFSMAIGFGAIGALRAVASDGLPPLGTALTNIVALLGVMAIGVAHLGPIQIWGGLFGIAMFAPTVLASVRLRRFEPGE